MSSMTDDNLQHCECCDARVPIATMTSCGDGCWMCEACAAEAAEEFRTCKHEWEPAHDEYGDLGQFCTRCSHIVLDADFERMFGARSVPIGT